MNKTKLGFSLIELMAAIVILAFIMRFVMPNIGRKPRYEREQFVARLNSLTQLAWQRAIVTHKIQQVTFDMTKKQVTLFEQSAELERDGEPKFVPSKSGYVSTSVKIPDNIDIKNFAIEGHDEMEGKKRVEAWFYIVPEGLAQDAVINFVDKKDRIDNKVRKFRLDLNPFNAQFSVIEL